MFYRNEPKSKKNKAIIALIVISLLLASSAFYFAHTQDTKGKYELSTIKPASTSNGWIVNQNFSLNSPWNTNYLLTSTEYDVTVTISVPALPSGSVSNFTVSLNAHAEQTNSVTPFWSFKNSYAGSTNATHAETFDKNITFSAVSGQLILSGTFKIPHNATQTTSLLSNGAAVVLDSPIANQSAITVMWGNVNEGSVGPYTLIDVNIQTYLEDLGKVNSLSVPSNYKSLVNEMVSNAKNLSAKGEYTAANQILLNVINYKYPAPPSSIFLFIFIGLAIAGFAVVGVLAVLWSRAKWFKKENERKIKDAINNLASLEVSAAKYDKSLQNKIKDITESLKR